MHHIPKDWRQLLKSIYDIEAEKEKIAASKVFAVCWTNPDYEIFTELYRGKSLDIAETIMYKKFSDQACQEDYMIIDVENQDIVQILWSDQSKIIIGEDGQ